MKKVIFFFLLIFAIQLIAEAKGADPFTYRRKVFKAGQKYYDFGFGVYNLFRPVEGKTSILTVFQNYSGPIISFKFEYALSKHFGISAKAHTQYVYYSWQKSIMEYNPDTWTLTETIYPEKYRGFSYGLSTRINWHFAGNQYNDFYWGAGIGYEMHSLTLKTEDPLSTRAPYRLFPFIPEGVFGFRTHGDKAIYFAEIGFGKNIFTLGISLLPE